VIGVFCAGIKKRMGTMNPVISKKITDFFMKSDIIKL